MSEVRLAEGEFRGPFWGAVASYITGQDHLGMQLASISTYSTLLPGLTNLTQRLRYYGFYTWLLELYAAKDGRDSIDSFRRFMRRGELLLAFVMVRKQDGDHGVVGSRFARKDLTSGKTEVDLAMGADRLGYEGGYWNFRSGAFGQYYQGPLKDIGLIRPSDIRPEIFVCTSLGRQLAGHFKEGIPDEIQGDFLGAIKSGNVSAQALDSFLGYFNLSGIEVRSEEWSFYMNLLFGPDSPTSLPDTATWMRKQTLLHFLFYLEGAKENPVTGFARSFYRRNSYNDVIAENAAAEGWYFFGLNELGHFAMESLLWTFLIGLDRNGPGPLAWVSDTWVEGVLKELQEVDAGKAESPGTFLDCKKIESAKSTDPFDLADVIDRAKEEIHFQCAAWAIRILAILSARDPDLEKTWAKHSRPGDTRDLLKWLQCHQELPLREFLSHLISSRVLAVHLEVAMRKMGSRNENTLKFQDEDGLLRHIETVRPIWTGPRLYALYNFLSDLKLIIPETGLAEEGKEALRTHTL